MKTGNVKYILILLTLVYSCLPEGDYKVAVNYEPTDAGDGWEISSPNDQGLNPGKLKDVYEMIFAEDRFLTSRSLLIVRNGKLVSESYIRDRGDINRKNSIQGIAKSITSLLTGIAWDSDLIKLDDKLYKYIPVYFDGDRNKREITFNHLLTNAMLRRDDVTSSFY